MIYESAATLMVHQSHTKQYQLTLISKSLQCFVYCSLCEDAYKNAYNTWIYSKKKDFFSGIILRHAAVNYYLAVFFCQVV